VTRAGAAAARGPEAAPFYAEVAEASQGAHAFWIEARDGVRLRAALLSEGPEGTVLLFHGRTEYAEKYGAVARWLGGRGFSVLTVDWRGQGLSARLLPDVAVGHVVAFADYQADVAALLDAADSMGLPGPRHLLAHSMGGAIGLRALMEGLPVASAAFSAPMWGILMSAGLRPVARALGRASRPLGLAERYAPGTGPAPASVAFERNVLTGDRGTYERMRGQVAAHPELALGGPSLRWLHEALVEEVALARRPSPAVPCLCAVGSLEAVVSASVIRDRMSRWPTGRLVEVEGARHEILMETPDLREPFLESVAALFHTSS
jgi:lysophospholipase